ncbi:MAG: autoinducer binding domain-containing protein [Hydrogenophaga sp.]|nr:autoinducer binding domain-containing protein [Hydrogenophaga sp.]
MISADRQSLLSGEIASSQTRAQFMSVMGRVVGEFGLDHVTVMAAPSPSDIAITPLVLESTLPPQFAREFDKHQFLRYCPILPKFSNWFCRRRGTSEIPAPPRASTAHRRCMT